MGDFLKKLEELKKQYEAKDESKFDIVQEEGRIIVSRKGQ